MIQHVFAVHSVAEVREKRPAILESVRANGYATMRGLFDPAAIRAKLPAIFRYLNEAPHRPSSGVSPDEIRRNVSKWGIGAGNASQEGISRFMINIYNPLLDADLFGLHDGFRTLIELRDLMMNRETLTDEKLLPTHFNACRIHFYPAGGGFMSEHRDARGAAAIGDVVGDSGKFIQLSILLTQKGVDFDEGGVFIRTEEGIADLESGGISGDVFIWDGSTRHGVADIDPKVPFTPHAMRGRAIALVGVFDHGGLRKLDS